GCSSPAIVTSNCGMVRGDGPAFFLEDDHTAQVPWSVRIMSFSDACVESGELSGNDIERHARGLGCVHFELDQQIGGGSSTLLGTIGDYEGRSPQFLHFLENFEFRRVA